MATLMDQQLMRAATQTETRQRTQGFEDALRHSFAQAWDDATSAEHEALLRRWSDSIAKWLRKSSRSKSRHTERTYTRCLDSWWCFIKASPWLVSEERREVYEAFLKSQWIGPADYRSPWDVTQDDVQAYVMFLESEHPAWPWEAARLPQVTILAGEDERPMKPGCGPATVGQYMAAASSFYSYVRGVTALSNGIEIPIFADRRGQRRENPFKGSNVERPRVTAYGNSHPLSANQLARMWAAIGPTPLGETAQTRADQMAPLAPGPALIAARDRALYRLFIYTGRRAAEVARLRWRDITDHGGQYTFQWTGKGNKTDRQALPADAYWEIVAWLRAAGRWPAEPEQVVFVAVQPGSVAAFGHEPDPERAISTGQINNVVKKLARRAGIDPAQVHTHTLRHSFAYVYLENNGDVNQLRIMLGHESLATTTIYASSPAMKRPVDNYSQGFQQVLGF